MVGIVCGIYKSKSLTNHSPLIGVDRLAEPYRNGNRVTIRDLDIGSLNPADACVAMYP